MRYQTIILIVRIYFLKKKKCWCIVDKISVIKTGKEGLIHMNNNLTAEIM
ncbi:MAG: hypothetical protein K5644_06190 [Lachnospiraceae bacterium]|nr:hypothetical protein [Lachnospiraceae bacterium]